jgi:hypothetical protein
MIDRLNRPFEKRLAKFRLVVGTHLLDQKLLCGHWVLLRLYLVRLSHPQAGFYVCQIAAEGCLGIDHPTESTHLRFELPVAMCADGND